MKIKQIEQILKSRKTIIAVQTSDGQWIGNGFAFYPIHNMPDLTKENFFAMFDIHDDQKEKWRYAEMQQLPLKEDYVKEVPLDKSRLSVRWLGENYEILISQAGLIFINSKYLAPFADLKGKYELYRRIGGEREVIAVKAGLILIGLICPWIPNDEFIKDFNKLISKYQFTNFEKDDLRDADMTQMTLGGLDDDY